jgi:eukaryotic-like serine/threonine-protein kinase
LLGISPVFEAGTILHETYRIEGELGRGAMGVVYRASHLRVPRQFAIKVLSASIRDVERSFSRFRREAEISSRLGHPHIVEVFDFNRTDDGQAYFVMELLEGRNLAAELRAAAPLELRRVVEIVSPIASALHAAHAAGVIHRDLKPSNVFLAKRGEYEVVKVLDFGVSKVMGALDLTSQDESFIGTPAYMSPEQATGQARQVGAPSDQFSLASIAYEMVSGRHPFAAPEATTPLITLYRIQTQDPEPLEGVPASLAAVIGKALSKAPADRFADVAAFAAALRDAVGETAAPEVSVARPAPARRARRWFVGGALLALGGGLAAAVALRRPAASPPTSGTVPPPIVATGTPATATAMPVVPAPPAPARLALRVSPEHARVIFVGSDGTESTVAGPWSVTTPHVFVWKAAFRPRSARVEADGYEPEPLTLPAEGGSAEVTVRLHRRAVKPAAPKHPELSYPWRDR